MDRQDAGPFLLSLLTPAEIVPFIRSVPRSVVLPPAPLTEKLAWTSTAPSTSSPAKSSTFSSPTKPAWKESSADRFCTKKLASKCPLRRPELSHSNVAPSWAEIPRCAYTSTVTLGMGAGTTVRRGSALQPTLSEASVYGNTGTLCPESDWISVLGSSNTGKSRPICSNCWSRTIKDRESVNSAPDRNFMPLPYAPYA